MNLTPLTDKQIRVLRMLRRERERARRTKDWKRMLACDGILDAWERMERRGIR